MSRINLRLLVAAVSVGAAIYPHVASAGTIADILHTLSVWKGRPH